MPPKQKCGCGKKLGGFGYNKYHCNDAVKKLINIQKMRVFHHHQRCTSMGLATKITDQDIKYDVNNLIANCKHDIIVTCYWLKDKIKYLVYNAIQAETEKLKKEKEEVDAFRKDIKELSYYQWKKKYETGDKKK